MVEDSMWSEKMVLLLLLVLAIYLISAKVPS